MLSLPVCVAFFSLTFHETSRTVHCHILSIKNNDFDIPYMVSCVPKLGQVTPWFSVKEKDNETPRSFRNDDTILPEMYEFKLWTQATKDN